MVLGAGGGWAKPGGAACGYLLQHDGFNLWVDAGTGTMANLQEHIDLVDLDAVAISHRHFDHFLDIYPFYLSRVFDPDRPPPLPLFAPPGMFEHALQLEQGLADVFTPQVIEPGAGFEAGPFTVRTARMRHQVPTLGMRIECDGSTLAYSADTGPTEDLVNLARDADVLLAEATWIARQEGWDFVHMTAGEAGETGRRAGIRRLVLTHVWPMNDRQEVAEQASVAFGGSIDLAEKGLRVEVSHGS